LNDVPTADAVTGHADDILCLARHPTGSMSKLSTKFEQFGAESNATKQWLRHHNWRWGTRNESATNLTSKIMGVCETRRASAETSVTVVSLPPGNRVWSNLSSDNLPHLYLNYTRRFYIIEDIETSYYENYGGGNINKPDTFVALLKDLVDVLQRDFHGGMNSPRRGTGTFSKFDGDHQILSVRFLRTLVLSESHLNPTEAEPRHYWDP